MSYKVTSWTNLCIIQQEHNNDQYYASVKHLPVIGVHYFCKWSHKQLQIYPLSSNLKLDLLWAQSVQLRMPWECHDHNQEPLSTKWLIGLIFAVLNLQDSTSNAHDIIKMPYVGLYDWTLGIGWGEGLFMGQKQKCDSFFHLLFPLSNKYSPYSCYVPKLPF